MPGVQFGGLGLRAGENYLFAAVGIKANFWAYFASLTMNNMARIVGWQFVTVIVVAIASLLIGGEVAGISAALGGMSCVVPNMLFAVGVRVAERRKKQVSMGVFLVLEFLKIVMTMILMIAAVWFYRDVNWVYFLISLAIALKSHILLVYKNRS